jgi:hypothetical protein
MLTLSIISAVIGAVLGHFFKAFILPAAILLGSVTIIAIGMVEGQSTNSIAGACILFAVCLQWGYLAGAAIHVKRRDLDL